MRGLNSTEKPESSMSFALQNTVIVISFRRNVLVNLSHPDLCSTVESGGKVNSGLTKDTVKRSLSTISAQRASIRFIVCIKHYRCKSEHVIQGWWIRRNRHIGKAYATNEAARKDIVRNIERRKDPRSRYWNFDEAGSLCDLNNKERRMSLSRDRMGGIGQHGLAWVGCNLV